MVFLDPVIQLPGNIANTEYRARPATLVKNGAVAGKQTITLGGATGLGSQPYSIRYTRATDGYSWEVTGMLLLTRREQTLPLALQALSRNLNTYHDVQAVINGSDLVLTSKDANVTPTLTFLPPATLTTATSTVVNAIKPMPLAPGTVVGFSVDPASGEKLIAPIGSVPFEASNAGVIIRPLFQVSPHRAENQTYDVMTQGTIWMQLYGTAPIVPATLAVQVGNFDSTTPGLISVAGATATKFATVNLMNANGVLSKFNILDKNIPVGGKFRLELR